MTYANNAALLPSAEQLESEAASWLARIDKADDSNEIEIDLDDYAARDAEFEEWISRSPGHRVALLRLISVWKRTHRLGALKSPDVAVLKQNSSRLPLRRKIIGLAAAASILIIVGLANLNFVADVPAGEEYQTAKGGQKFVDLADGSKIELNSDTKLVADISQEKRIVTLDHGEAFFEVSHDKNRPFKIIAGDQAITVLGTKFAVHRKKNSIEVAVSEGKVQIDDLTDLQENPLIILTAGDIAEAEKGGFLLVRKDLKIVLRELSWRQKFIDFDNAPLIEAAAEFNRYNHTMLVIKDTEISKIRVSGKFKTDNLEAFVRFLTNGFGFHVSRTGKEILISG